MWEACTARKRVRAVSRRWHSEVFVIAKPPLTIPTKKHPGWGASQLELFALQTARKKRVIAQEKQVAGSPGEQTVLSQMKTFSGIRH